jgi:hypothetical protein
MSRIDFKNLVSSLLLEAISPDWYKDVIERFKEITKDTIITDAIPPTGDLLKTLLIAIKGDVSTVSTKQIAINYLSIFDLVVALIETKWGKSFKQTSQHTIEAFMEQCPGYGGPETGPIITAWLNNDTYTWGEYSPLTRNGVEVQRKALGEIDVLGRVALQTYNDKNILDTTQSIVAKRINAFEAITSLRFGNFANFIKDVFNRLPGYVSGSIKVPNDFEKLADKMYVAEIFSIAAYSAFFYDSEIDRIMNKNTAQNQQSQTPNKNNLVSNMQQGQVNQATITDDGVAMVQASLNLYDKHKNTLILKEDSTVAILAAALTATGLTAAAVNRLKGRPYDPGFMNFVEKGIINTKIEGQEIKSNITYNIGEIQKIQTQEARQLIQKLQNIAQYTKTKKPGERLKYAQQALGAIAGAALPGGSGPGGIYQGPG